MVTTRFWTGRDSANGKEPSITLNNETTTVKLSTSQVPINETSKTTCVNQRANRKIKKSHSSNLTKADMKRVQEMLDETQKIHQQMRADIKRFFK